MKLAYLANDQLFFTKNFFPKEKQALERLKSWGKKGFIEVWGFNEESKYWEFKELKTIGKNISKANAIGPKYPRIADNCMRLIWGYKLKKEKNK